MLSSTVRQNTQEVLVRLCSACTVHTDTVYEQQDGPHMTYKHTHIQYAHRLDGRPGSYDNTWVVFPDTGSIFDQR